MSSIVTRERKIWKDGETLLEEDINKILQKCENPVKHITTTLLTPEEIEEKASVLNDLYPIDVSSSTWEGMNIPDNIQQAAQGNNLIYFVIYKLNNITFKDITKNIAYFSYEYIQNSNDYKEFNIDYITSYNSMLTNDNELIYILRTLNSPLPYGLMQPECSIRSAGKEEEVYFVVPAGVVPAGR